MLPTRFCDNYADMPDELNNDILHVNVPESAKSPEAIMRYLVGVLQRAGRVRDSRVEPIIEWLLKRESLGSTNVGNGIAVPHIQEPFAIEPVIVVGQLLRPTQWAETDVELVHSVWLVIASNTGDMLRCWGKVRRIK